MKKLLLTALTIVAFNRVAMASTVAVVEVNDDCTTKAMDATEKYDSNGSKSNEENHAYYRGYKDSCDKENKTPAIHES